MCVRRSIDQPGDGCGIAQVGSQLAVRVIEKIPLAGEASDFGRQRRVVDQVVVPDLPVRVRLDLIDAQSMAPSLLEMKAQLRLLCGGAQQEIFCALAPGSQVFKGRTDNLEA